MIGPFVTDCVYGVTRWQAKIDWLLGHVCRRPLETLTPWIRNALRLGVYQCLWMERVPHRAAVHETVELARRFGHQGTARFVNGVLRTLLRQYHHLQVTGCGHLPGSPLGGRRARTRNGWSNGGCNVTAGNVPRHAVRRTIVPLALPCVTNTLRITPQALAQRPPARRSPAHHPISCRP